MKYVNEQGGVDGVRLDMIWRDYGPGITAAISAHRTFKEARVAVVINQGSSTGEAVIGMCQKDEIPMVNQGYFTQKLVTEPIRWMFGAASSFSADFAFLMKWATDNWTEKHPPRIGYVFYDYSSGWEGLAAADYATDLGIEFIGHEVVPFMGCLDTSTELLRLAAKEPDWIYAICGGASGTVLVKDIARLKLQERGINFCWGVNMLDETQLRILGEDLEGWYFLQILPFMEDPEAPAFKTVCQAARRYRGWEPEEIPSIYFYGWHQSAVAIEGVRLAIEKVGLENLTGRAVRDALASIKDFNSGLVPPVTMSDDWPYFCPLTFVGKVEHGKRIHVTERMEAPWVPEWAPGAK